MRQYEEKFGIKFVGWYNVAHGWDFDNVILLDLPDYGTLDKLEADEADSRPRPPRRGVDVRTPPLDVPPGAHGPGSRVSRATEGHAMDTSRNDQLGELAADASLERTDFLAVAAEQLQKFLDANRDRIARPRRADPDRRRTRLPGDRARPLVPQPEPLPGRRHRRVGQRDRGRSRTRAELVELYNPADVFAAFAEAAPRPQPGSTTSRPRPTSC